MVPMHRPPPLLGGRACVAQLVGEPVGGPSEQRSPWRQRPVNVIAPNPFAMSTFSAGLLSYWQNDRTGRTKGTF
jgi:hypothetical protein